MVSLALASPYGLHEGGNEYKRAMIKGMALCGDFPKAINAIQSRAPFHIAS
jgi:hypothetical protein